MKNAIVSLIFLISFLVVVNPVSAYDSDGDGVIDILDNCPYNYNPYQEDEDGDGVGNACDSEPGCVFDNPCLYDNDCDGIINTIDNCMYDYNPYQEDLDADGVGDICDYDLVEFSCTQIAFSQYDSDGDGIIDTIDNCPYTYNPYQEDSDGDGIGDVCDIENIDPILISNISDQIWDEDTNITINLSNYFYDENGDSLTYSYTQLTNIIVQINDNLMTFSPLLNWNGDETIIITVNDGVSAVSSNNFSLTINPVNDVPFWSVNLSDVVFEEDFSQVVVDGVLGDFVSDVDGDSLSFSVVNESSSEVNCEIENDFDIVLYSVGDWNGVSSCTLRVSDGNGGFADNAFSITINPINDAPIVSDIPNQEITSGENFVTFDLDDYVQDVDDAISELTWSFSGTTSLTVIINSENVVNIDYPLEWYGSETITFTATDVAGASNSDSMFASVLMPNFPPEVSITEPENGTNFATNNSIIFIANGSDPNNDELSYIWDFGDENTAEGRIAYHNYTGIGTFNVTVYASDGQFSTMDSVEIIVYENSFDIQNLNSYEDNQFSSVQNVFFRNETLYLKFEVYSINDGNAAINMINTVELFNENTGTGDVNLQAYNGFVEGENITDGQLSNPDGSYYYFLPNIPLSDALLGTSLVFVFSFNGTGSDHAYLSISILNNEPVLQDIPDIEFLVNETASVSLDDFVSDLETIDEDIDWTFSGNDNVILAFDSQTREVTFSSSAWVGSEIINFSVDDTDGGFDSDLVSVTILQTPNQPPELTSIPDMSVMVDSQLTYQFVCIDPDGDDLLYYDDVDLFDVDSYGLIDFTPSTEQVGEYEVLITCSDGEFNVSDSFSLSILPLQTGPEIYGASLTAYIFRTFNYQVVASDANGDVLSFTDDSSLFDINETTGIISFVPGVELFAETHSFVITVSDGYASVSENFDIRFIFFDPPQCSDGLDNDNDGRTDFPDDSGCSSPTDDKELYINRDFGNGIRITRLNAYGIDYNTVMPGDYVMIGGTFRNDLDVDINNLLVGVIVPELGIKQVIKIIDIDAGESKSARGYLYLPRNVHAGDYYFGVYVSSNGVKKTKYMPVRII